MKQNGILLIRYDKNVNTNVKMNTPGATVASNMYTAMAHCDGTDCLATEYANVTHSKLITTATAGRIKRIAFHSYNS